MELSVWYWLCFALYVFLGGWYYYAPERPWYRNYGGYVLHLVLLFIIGYRLFGSAVK